MDPQLAAFPRRRVIWAQYFMSFSWSLGLWAAVPVIPILSLQLNENIAMAGLVVSIGGAGRFFVSYITGPLLDQYGRRGIGGVGVFIRMVFSFLEGLSPTYFSLLAFRFGSGIGTSVWGTAQQTITADISTPEDRGRISGRKQGFAQLGGIIGPVVGGAAWAITGDIRVPFFINGFSKMACLLVMIFIMVETRQLSARATPASPAPARETARLARPSLIVRLGGVPSAIAALAATGFLYVLIGTFAVNLMRSTVQDLVLPVYVEEALGLAESQLGIVIAAMGFGGLLTSFGGGWAADRWGVQAVLVPGALAAAAGLALTAQGPGLAGMVASGRGPRRGLEPRHGRHARLLHRRLATRGREGGSLVRHRPRGTWRRSSAPSPSALSRTFSGWRRRSTSSARYSCSWRRSASPWESSARACGRDRRRRQGGRRPRFL